MNIYILLKKRDVNSVISKLICDYTESNYSHSFMVCDTQNDYKCWYELNEHNYNIKLIDKTEINKFINENNYSLYVIKNNFSIDQLEKIKLFWYNEMERHNHYGYFTLFTMFTRAKMQKFYEWYYKKTSKVFNPLFSKILKDNFVCSTIIDSSIKYAGFDLFENLDEDVIFPGMYSENQKIDKIEKL